MGSFLVKRIALTVFVVWAALTIMFVLLWAMPGDPASLRAGEKALSPTIVANLQRKYGLDQPIINQYGRFFKNLAQWDLGFSQKNDESVNKTLKDTVKTSLRLFLWGGLVQIGGSLVLGFLSAARKNSLADRLTTVASVAAQAIPVFVSGLLFQVFFGVIPNGRNIGWLNFFQRWPDHWHLGIIPAGNWKGIVLPAIVVGIVQMALLARLLRSSMLETLKADYLRTATAKGLPRMRVLVKHALRNALIPYVTAAGLALVEIFGIAVQTETVFSLPGLGSKIGEAASAQDGPMVLGLSSVVILSAALMSLLVDFSYGLIDPRIRVGQKRE